MGSDGVEVELVIPAASAPPTPSVTTPTRPSPGRPHLPSTGFDLVPLLLLAVAAIALGAIVARLSLWHRRST